MEGAFKSSQAYKSRDLIENHYQNHRFNQTKMKIFALTATLAVARQRRAAFINEQGGTWYGQFEQVSDQVPQVSNQVPQVSNQVPQKSNQVPQKSNQVPQVSNQVAQVSDQIAQVSNQVAQVSDQVPQVSNQKAQISNQSTGTPKAVLSCEDSSKNNKGGFWLKAGSTDICNLNELIRQNVATQWNQFNYQFGNGDETLSNAWNVIRDEWGNLSNIEFYNKNKEQTGCGLAKVKHQWSNNYIPGYSYECGLLCEHIYDIENEQDFKPVLDELAGIVLISFQTSTFRNYRNFLVPYLYIIYFYILLLLLYILGDEAINAAPKNREACAESQTKIWRAIAAFEGKLGKIDALPEPRTNWMATKY